MGLRNKGLFKNESCFFVTTTCFLFKSLIKASDSYIIIEESLSFVNKKYKTDVLAYVIMPNHLHLILYFKEENHLSSYMRDMKKYTSTQIRINLEKTNQLQLLETIRRHDTGRSFQTWMDRYDDVYLNNKKQLEIKMDYIHMNPLQEHWNLVQYPSDYQYSSSIYYERGIQPGLIITDYREYFE